MNPPPDPKLPFPPDPGETNPLSDRTLPGGLAFGPPAAADELGTLGRFRIQKELGRGGMGAVFLALDPRLQRQIALKVMLPEAALNPIAKDRFLREARAAARISHDNVIGILDTDEMDGIPFIALPYLQGYPLDQYLKKKGNLSISQVLRIGREMALGLAAAHDLGVVHRDIKPGNVWLEAPNGRVKILDFGLAKPATEEEAGKELTHSGAIMGTPAYMAPEQAAGLKVDHRADLYSLGTVLYRLVAGRTPFERPGGMMAVLTALAIEPPPPVEHFNPDVPPPLAALIHELLRKDRDHRPQTAKDVAQRLIAIRENRTAVPDVSLAPQQPPAYVAVPVTIAPQANAFEDIDEEATDRDQAKSAPTGPPPARPNRKLLFALLAVALLFIATGTVVVSKLLKPPEKSAATDTKPQKDDAPVVNTPKKTTVPQTTPPPPPPIQYDPWVPTEVVSVKPIPRGPLDDLDPTKVPAGERTRRPKELVALAVGAASAEYAPALGAGVLFAGIPEQRTLAVLEGAFQATARNKGLRSPGASFRAVQPSPDGRSVAGLGEGGTLVGYTTDGGGIRDLIQLDASVHGAVGRFAWGPDSQTLYFVNGQNRLYRWKPFTADSLGEKLLDLGYDCPHLGFPHSLAVSPTGKVIANCSPAGVELIALADSSRPRRTLVPDSDEKVTTVAFSPGNRFLYFNRAEVAIRRVDLSSTKLEGTEVAAEAALAPHRFELGTDGTILVTTRGATIHWWNAAAEPYKLLGAYIGSAETTAWQLAPDGRHLVIAEAGAVQVLRLLPSPAK